VTTGTVILEDLKLSERISAEAVYHTPDSHARPIAVTLRRQFSEAAAPAGFVAEKVAKPARPCRSRKLPASRPLAGACGFGT
jgi:hypothetical protein